MTIPELHRALELLRRFNQDLVTFEVELQRLWSLKKYTGNEWMAGPQPDTAVHQLGIKILVTLEPLRDEIGKNIDAVTRILDEHHVPTGWQVNPPPMIGGYVKKYNAFYAFIDLELDRSARPTLLQITDLVSQAIWRVDKQIDELRLNPPNPPNKLALLPKWIGNGLGWLFPTEKQRGVLGWVLIAGFILTILRFLFGIHIEEAGKLLLKLFKIDK